MEILLAKWTEETRHPWGRLPFAEGHIKGISVTYEKSIGIIINGVHPNFVKATRQSQGKADPTDHG